MKQQRKEQPFYLILVLIFFLLHHYNNIFGFIPATQILHYSIICLFTGVVFLILHFTHSSSRIAGILTFSLLCLFLFFGQYHDFLKRIFYNSFLSSYKVVIPVALGIALILAKYLHSRPYELAKLSRYLNLLFAILCSIEIFSLLVNTAQFFKDKNLIFPDLSMCKNYESRDLQDSLKPDIYYLVFDEYTSNKALQELWHFENSPITDWLSNQGFHVIPESKSNYTATPFSISSALNMNYLEKEKGHEGSAVNYLKATKSLSTNETFCMLKKEHYLIRFLAPFDNSIEENGLFSYFDYLSYEEVYFSTLLGRFKKDVLWNFKPLNSGRSNKPSLGTRKADDLKLTIEKVKATVDTSINRKPKFVYGHFLIPHEPHIFDSTGKIRSFTDLNNGKEPYTSYIQQILYANKIIKDLVSHIQSGNKKRTVIIIQGDHGYRDLPVSMETYYFPIFNAVYFPDKDYRQLYDEISMVNIFRVLFNHYFYQKFELLKDSSIRVK